MGFSEGRVLSRVSNGKLFLESHGMFIVRLVSTKRYSDHLSNVRASLTIQAS